MSDIFLRIEMIKCLLASNALRSINFSLTFVATNECLIYHLSLAGLFLAFFYELLIVLRYAYLIYKNNFLIFFSLNFF